MYVDDNPEYKNETAMLIEEFLNQRLLGFENEVGQPITPAFPKLLYVLDEDNIHEDSPYWYLTELAAKCTAKRMVPDYISAKIMRRDKIDKNGNGNVYGCMGKRKLSPTPFNLAKGCIVKTMLTVRTCLLCKLRPCQACYEQEVCIDYPR